MPPHYTVVGSPSGSALRKGQLEVEVAWIGGTIIVEAGGVRVRIKESIVPDICDDLRRITSNNVATLKELHFPIRKLGHAASLLIIMRPFMEPLWAALYDTSHSTAPVNTVWTRQIVVTLKLFKAFFVRDSELSIERFFRLGAYLRVGRVVEVGTDASPWGMGGWLCIDGV